MAHARLSASGAHRWTACAGSATAEVTHSLVYGEPKSSSAASEGTYAHDLAEKVLSGQIKKASDDEKASDEMVEHIQNYVDYIRDRNFDEYRIEKRVNYDHIAPKGFGTADVVGIKGTTLYVIDLKYGRYPVKADANLQGILYLIGAQREFKEATNFVFEIYQPRIDNFSRTSYTKTELQSWATWIKDRANLTLSENAPRVASSEACKFCIAKAHCPTYYNYTSSILGKPSDNLDEYDNERLIDILDHKTDITNWLASIEEHLKQQLLSGNDIPNLSLRRGRKTRGWLDTKKVVLQAEELGYSPFEQRLASPAKMQKTMGKDYELLKELEDIKYSDDKLVIDKDIDLFDKI